MGKNILLLFIFLFSITSCSPPDPAQLIGEWIPEENAPKQINNIALTEQPYIIFNDNGTFNLKNIPEVLLGGFRYETNLISGGGYWHVGKYYGENVIFLEFNEIDGKKITSATQIQISKGFRNITLYLWIDDEGGPRFEFQKRK